MKIGISLVVFNEPKDRLLIFLKNLQVLLNDYDFKIIIYQNSILKFDIPDNILLLGNGDNIGYGSAHNKNFTWFRHNNFSKVLICNTDISFCSGISPLFYDFQDIIVTCPLILDSHLNQQRMIRSLPNILDKLVSFFKDYKHFKLVENENEFLIPSFSGCFFVIHVSNFLKLGEKFLFDERFFLYEEDTDLSRRIWNYKGAKLIPKVKIIHDHQKGSKRKIKLLLYHIKSIYYYFKKWGFFDIESYRSRNYLKNI